MAKTIKTTFKLRRGLANEWKNTNPILAEGEPGFEIDTNKLKIGNGKDNYNTLKYISGEANSNSNTNPSETVVATEYGKKIVVSSVQKFTLDQETEYSDLWMQYDIAQMGEGNTGSWFAMINIDKEVSDIKDLNGNAAMFTLKSASPYIDDITIIADNLEKKQFNFGEDKGFYYSFSGLEFTEDVFSDYPPQGTHFFDIYMFDEDDDKISEILIFISDKINVTDALLEDEGAEDSLDNSTIEILYNENNYVKLPKEALTAGENIEIDNDATISCTLGQKNGTKKEESFQFEWNPVSVQADNEPNEIYNNFIVLSKDYSSLNSSTSLSRKKLEVFKKRKQGEEPDRVSYIELRSSSEYFILMQDDRYSDPIYCRIYKEDNFDTGENSRFTQLNENLKDSRMLALGAVNIKPKENFYGEGVDDALALKACFEAALKGEESFDPIVTGKPMYFITVFPQYESSGYCLTWQPTNQIIAQSGKILYHHYLTADQYNTPKSLFTDTKNNFVSDIESVVLGRDNYVSNSSSCVLGSDNSLTSTTNEYTCVVGYYNEVGENGSSKYIFGGSNYIGSSISSTYIIGKDNKIDKDIGLYSPSSSAHSIILGESNAIEVSATHSVISTIIGHSNYLRKTFTETYILGHHLFRNGVVDTDYQTKTILGSYNKYIPEDIFEIGGGTDEDSRLNVFGVTRNHAYRHKKVDGEIKKYILWDDEKKLDFLNPSSATTADLIQALINKGIMKAEGEE